MFFSSVPLLARLGGLISFAYKPRPHRPKPSTPKPETLNPREHVEAWPSWTLLMGVGPFCLPTFAPK